MVRKALSEFKLNIGGTPRDGKLPFSIFSALKNVGEVSGEYISAVFEMALTKQELSSRHHAAIFNKVVAPFSVYVNGESACDVLASKERLFIDLSGRLVEGENSLELRFFPKGEELLSAGVYGIGEFVRYDNALIDGIAINQRIEGGVVNLGISISTVGEAENVRAVATLISSSGQIYYGGLTRGRGSIVIKDPLYWWPKGLGVQNLYKLTVNLYGEREIEDTLETRIGIRKISTPVRADSSHLEVNGVPFLPMGAVYRPIKENTPSGFEKKIRAVVTNAAMAGFNALVVPKNVRAPEQLYELCDVHGIVVIREFSGAREEDYLELVRLSKHPSLGFLDYVSSGDEAIAAAEKMQKLRPDLEFSMVTSLPVYPSEPSLPISKSYEEILPKKERNLFSEKVKELAQGKEIEILKRISEDHLCPCSLSEAAYLSGIVASDRIFEFIAKSRTEGNARAVFDSLCDDSSFIGGSSVDSLGRRKPLHYKTETAFKPLAVFAQRDEYTVGFSVSNERRLAFIGELEFKIIDNKNRVIYKEIADCQVAKNSSKKILAKDVSEYIKGHESEYYIEYYIKEGLTVASRGTLIFTKPKSFNFLDPGLKLEISGRDKRYSLTVTAEAFAKGVELTFEDHDVLLSENYVDLTHNSPYKISFSLLGGEDSTYSLMKSVRVRSLYDIK